MSLRRAYYLFTCLFLGWFTLPVWAIGQNVALRENGGMASASSTYSAAFSSKAVNDGDRRGMNWGAGGGWNDATNNVYPDWLQISFNGVKAINEIDVFTVQDNYTSPAEPTPSMTFSRYGIRDFEIQYWTGTTWSRIAGGSVSNNNLVWRKFTFPTLNTDRIRVLIKSALAAYSRVVEVEAYTANNVNNIASRVSLTAPANSASYAAPGSITLNATAADSDGTITRVEFYNGATLLGSDSSAPYSYTWSNVAAGAYTLSAKAYDNTGVSSSSPAIIVTVITPAPNANESLAPAPSISVSAMPAIVFLGASSTLNWSSTNATSCIASGAWSGSKLGSGSEIISNITAPGTYTLACSGAGGTGSQSAIIAVVAATPSSQPSADSGITTVAISNRNAEMQTNVATTFGQYFKQGDVPAGYTVRAELAGGISVPLQVDKKARHADGSLRHAVLSSRLSSIAGLSTQTITLLRQADSVVGTAVSLSNLLATSFDSVVSLNIGGTVYTASAKNLLQTTTPKLWLSGPEVSEWIVGAPVKTSAGVAHPHLTAYFHIRAYADSPITRVRVDAVVENNWTLVSNPSDFVYDVTLSVGGSTVYSQAGLKHFSHTRWHQRAWWGGDPQLYAKLNIVYLQDSKAIPKYEALTPSETFLNSVRQSTPPMMPGDQVDMDQAGAADGIGPLPRWDAIYAVSGDQRAFNYMNANHDGAAAYPAHFRDEITKLPATIDSYPNADTQGWTGASPLIPLGSSANTNNTGNFTSHRPSIGYLAYLTTGDYYYLEEMQFWNAFDVMWSASYVRGGVSAYGGNGSTGIFWDGTLRGTAWAFRNLAQVASITPDADPLKSYFTTKLENNLAYLKWQYVDRNSAQSNGLGMMFQAGRNDPSSSQYGEYRMWYDAFITWSLHYVVELGFTSAIPMRDYKLKTPIGMMGLAANESCFQWVPQYISHVGPLSSSPLYYATFREVYDATAVGASAHVCGSQDMANYLSSVGGRTYIINEMTGGQSFAYYYFSSMQPALAAAADSGLAGGATAWSRGLLSGVHPDYRDEPNWAVIPRGLSETLVPSVTLSANPTSVTRGESTTLSWSGSNVTSCLAAGAWSGAKAIVGSQLLLTLTLSGTYSLTCSGAGGSASQSATVTITQSTPSLSISLSANPSSVVSGTSSTLTWSAPNAIDCTASGAWSGVKAASGNQSTGVLNATSTFMLACTGSGGSSASQAVTVLVSTPGSNAIDKLQAGQWYEVPNSKMSNVNPCPANNCSYTGVQGQAAAISSWSGGVYDTRRDRLLVWGGGHHDYAGNEIYAFDVNALQWTRVTNPTTNVMPDVPHYSDGTPISRHTGGSIAYDSMRDSMVTCGAPGAFGIGYSKLASDVFSFSANTWRSVGDVPTSGGYQEMVADIAVYDPQSDRMWCHTTLNGALFEFNPGTQAWTRHEQSYLSYYQTATLDTRRHRMVSIGGVDGLRVWNLDTPDAAPVSPMTSGAADGITIQNSQAPGFAYDPVNDVFVAWNGGPLVYTLNPKTWVWTKVSPSKLNATIPTAGATTGTNGRFRYIPSKNAFIVVNSASENVFVYKLNTAASPGTQAPSGF